MKRYFGNWAEGGRAEMAKDFDIAEAALPSESAILFAGYWHGSYDGNARVLYRKDGKLYEVNGGHCSCNGLEQQWDHGGEVTPASLAMRPNGLDEYSADTESREAWLQIVAKLNGRRR
jgi:hypothetical protein